MAQERPLTPEKQLLKIIEDPKTNEAIVKAQAIRRQGLSLFSYGAWLGRLSFFKEGFANWFKEGPTRQQLDVKGINKFLGLSVVALTVYFMANFSASYMNLKKAPNMMGKASLKRENYKDSSLSKKDVGYYLEKVRSRDIFKMGKPEVPAPVIQTVSSRILEETQNLKLVGISWSDDPDAMIEDTRSMKTFFIKRGQLIGEVKVQAIFKDKVVLSYGGEETELR